METGYHIPTWILNFFSEIFIKSKTLDMQEWCKNVRNEINHLPNNKKLSFYNKYPFTDAFFIEGFHKMIDLKFLRSLDCASFDFTKEEEQFFLSVMRETKITDPDALADAVIKKIEALYPQYEKFYKIYFGVGDMVRCQKLMRIFLIDHALYTVDMKTACCCLWF